MTRLRGWWVAPLLTLFGCGEPGADMQVDDVGAQDGLGSDGTGTTCPNYSALKSAYFGDLHVHTSMSADAYSFGTRNDPASAYAFARGKPLQLAGGATTQIDRPLDFAAVTDHSEFLTGSWSAQGQYADDANVSCSFTAFRGYEYTKSNNGVNQHRNVIFKNSIVPSTMYGATEYPEPADLWSALENGCKNGSGCDVVAIPHNSNQSKGQKFLVESETPEVAAQRADIEVLAEIFQGKGNSECLNTVDPADQGYDTKCDFELLSGATGRGEAPGYVRAGLGAGLLYYAQTGINPVQVGFIGSTDTHNATPGNVLESAWPGNHGVNDNTPRKRLTRSATLDFNPGGLAVVWAQQNTRASIFAALKRRETYATSGPRMLVRFYQTWDASDLCADPGFPAKAEANGVPMGRTMPVSAPASVTTAAKNPRFVVYAAKDATNLAEIDIVKASIVNGQVRERVVALMATDAAQGDKTMCRTWTDLFYDPAKPAFYYARVLETPTPRWSHYDCVADPADCQRDELIQERAWTSPIWSLP